MASQLKVIGLSGPMCSGKSTIARAIFNCTQDVTLKPMAGPLKHVASIMGWDGKKDARGRRLLQTLGTQVGRRYNPDLWVNLWKQDLPSEGVVIVDDVRFINEADAIHDVGGKVFQVRGRAEVSAWKRFFGHASERGLPEHLIDDTVFNTWANSPGDIAARISVIMGLYDE